MSPGDASAAGPYGDPGWEKQKVSPLDVANLLLRNRWIVAAFSVILPLLVAVATVLSPESWTASTSFMPQGAGEATSRLENLAGQFGVAVPARNAGESPAFYSDLLTSREVLGTLAGDTFSVVVDEDPREVRGGTLADLRGLDIDDPARRRDAVIRWLRREAVSVRTDSETGVIEVEVTTPWPGLSTDLARRLVALVNEFNLETRQSRAAAERRFIEERVDEARRDLRAAEDSLETFLRNNRQFQNSPELVFRHDRLQREVGMRQQVFSSLVQSYEQARISEVRNTPLITVIEEAEVPVKPDPARLPLRMALGLILGGILGVFVAGGREYVRRSREGDAEDYREFTDLWKDTLRDLRRPFRR